MKQIYSLLIAIIFGCAILYSQPVIPPGIGTIENYLDTTNYEEYILVNEGVYEPLTSITIDRKVTFRAQDLVTLPALDNLPVIKNTYSLDAVIITDNGADLEMIGIDIDGNGTATRAISWQSVETGNIIEGIHLNRCRIHGTTGDLVGGLKLDTVSIKSATFRNTFAYDGGAHGIYIKDIWANGGEHETFVFENITYWNLAQQFNWIQVKTPDITSRWVYDHITGYNIGTDGFKELWGNSEKEATYEIQFTNTILSKQPTSSTTPSLYFTSQDGNSVSGVHSHEIRNIVLNDVNETNTRGVGERGDATDVIEMVNIYSADPQFADPTNGDFTIGNTDYLTAGDDGTILGATYWHPDFVDDYSDLIPGSSICTLDSIFINGDALYNFKSDTLSYVVKLADGLSIPIVAYTKTDEASFDTIINASDLTGTKEERTTTIKITSPNKALTKEYKIEFVILSNDATLSSILINYVPLEDFSPEKKDYQIDLVNKPASIPEVFYNVNHAGATAKAIQATNLEGTKEERTATISVVAENEVDSTLYTVLFNLLETSSTKLVDYQNQWFYPTKVENKIFLKSDITYKSVTVISLTGSKVFSELVTATGITEIDLSTIPTGIYVIQAETPKGMLIGRFLKE